MLIPIYWGTRIKLKKDLPIGIQYCPTCKKFTAWFLGRSRKIWHFNYIPLYAQTQHHFLICGICECGETLTEALYIQMRSEYQSFKDKKQQIACYKKAEALARTLPAEAASADVMLSQLSAEFPVSVTPFLTHEYRMRFLRMLCVFGIPTEAPEAITARAEQRNPTGMETI